MLLTTKKEYPMREYTPERLRHLTLLAEKYPTALSAYSEIIRRRCSVCPRAQSIL